MPGEIDTGGPRVLHRNPDCPLPIDFNDKDNSVQPDDDDNIDNENNYSIIWQKLSRESWRIRKRQWREAFRRKQMSKSNSATCVFRGQNDVAVKENKEVVDSDEQQEYQTIQCLTNNYHEKIDNAERDPRLRLSDARGLPGESSQCYSSSKSKYSRNHQRPSDDDHDDDDDDGNWFFDRKCYRKSEVYKLNIERRRKTRINRKSRLFNLNIVLLLLLIVIGHGKLVRTSLAFASVGTLFGSVNAAPVDLDSGIRAERSANLSHITGASRKIQMYIKNRHLQILPDGTVNGSNDDTSDYTIFQRTSVSRGQLRIQGVATCLYLCMDSCGLLYGSREYTEDCVFNETLEQHNYNTYSSVRWSTARKTLYLGLNRHGQPRRVQARGHNLGRLSAYARVLTQVAPADRVEALQTRMLGAHHGVRHHHNAHHHRNIQQSICPTLPAQEKDGRDRFRCRKRKKRKKRKRRCEVGEEPGPNCELHNKKDNSGRIDNIEMTTSSEAPASKSSCEITMDTTPPERTEDYLRATAPTIAEGRRTQMLQNDLVNDSGLLKAFSLGRLAM